MLQLRNERKRRGLTLRQVAEDTGYSAVSIRDLELGKRDPTYGLLLAMETYYGKPHTVLLAQAEPDDTSPADPVDLPEPEPASEYVKIRTRLMNLNKTQRSLAYEIRSRGITVTEAMLSSAIRGGIYPKEKELHDLVLKILDEWEEEKNGSTKKEK